MPGLLAFPEKACFRNENGPSLPTSASVFHSCVSCGLSRRGSAWQLEKAKDSGPVEPLSAASLPPMFILPHQESLARPRCPYQSLDPRFLFCEGSIPSLGASSLPPPPIAQLREGPECSYCFLWLLLPLSTFLHHPGRKIPQGSVLCPAQHSSSATLGSKKRYPPSSGSACD